MTASGSDAGVLPDVVEHLVDERSGVLNSVFSVDLQAGSPEFFHMFCRASNTSAFVGQENFSNVGGASVTRDGALAKAVGEGVERYCAAIFDVDDFPLFAYRDRPGPAVEPREFALYDDAQYSSPGFPWVPFDEDSPVRWTPGLDVVADETVFVPACRVVVPYHYYLGGGEAPIDQPISTGLACHGSWDRAALSGVYEAIERDAFTIFWQAMLAPPQIPVDTLDDANYDLARRFESLGHELTILDLRMDHGIPTILSVLRGNHPEAAASVFAAASSLDPKEAVRKSLEELAHTRRYAQWIRDNMPMPALDLPHHTNVMHQEDHLNLYAWPVGTPLTTFVYESEKRVEFHDIPNLSSGDAAADLSTACRKIAEVGERVVVVDLTSPDIASLGLVVVRAVVPGFHPLHMGFSLRARGGRRLWEVPQTIGYPGITRAGGDNPAPHPYP